MGCDLNRFVRLKDGGERGGWSYPRSSPRDLVTKKGREKNPPGPVERTRKSKK